MGSVLVAFEIPGDRTYTGELTVGSNGFFETVLTVAGGSNGTASSSGATALYTTQQTVRRPRVPPTQERSLVSRGYFQWTSASAKAPLVAELDLISKITIRGALLVWTHAGLAGSLMRGPTKLLLNFSAAAVNPGS